jgi:hypothetical protein
MANRKILVDNAGAGPAVWTASLDTTGQLNMGDAALGAVGSWVLQVSGTFSGSLVLRKKVIGSIVADASAPTTHYENSATNVAVAAGTAITGAGLFKVPCDGCVLILDYTATSGTMLVESVNILG